MSIPIRIFDEDLNFIREIDEYLYLKWNYRWRTCDSFLLKANRYGNGIEELQKGRIVAIYRYEAWHGGIIEEVNLSLNEEGKASEDYEITGRTLDGLMLDKLCLHDTDSGDGYDIQNGAAETIMKHYVDVNMVNATDADRNIPILEIEADQGRGANFIARGRFQTLAEILELICLYSGLGWGIVINPSTKKLVFKVYEGLDRSFENGVNPSIVFSPEFGNVRILTFKNSNINSQNVLYIAGQGEAADRNVRKVTKDGLSYIGLTRREIFQDARDTNDNTELDNRANAVLAEIGEEVIFEAESLELGAFTYWEDFKRGDIVTIDYPGIAQKDTRIIELEEEITPDDIRQVFIFGKKFPDLKDGIIRVANKIIRTVEVIGGAPSDIIVMWPRPIADIPLGWHLCDGAGDTPDLRGRFIVGAGGSYAIGNTGGAASVTLTINQIPSHYHSIAHTHTIAHTHSYAVEVDGVTWHHLAGGGAWQMSWGSRTTDGSSAANSGGSSAANSGSRGGSTSHENRPPFYALAFIMKL
ncbi:hypothetical protein ES708_20591 [subsurface metagenome]